MRFLKLTHPFVSIVRSPALFLTAAAAALATPLADGKEKFLGCAYSTAQATDFAAYWNQVTPENGGKWGSVEATRDVMNWTDLDAAYNFAKANGCLVRFHILVWGSQQPSWISNLPAAEQLEEIKEWFAAVAERYPDLDYIEVVNEPLHAPPNGEYGFASTTRTANYIAALGGSGTTGWDWIINSFKLARQYFPGKKLVLNEYGVTNDASAMARYIAIINLLKAENLIDVVSFQGHSFAIKNYSTATLSANLATLAATGLPIMVTEMDIDDTDAAPQLADYQRIFPLFWEHPSVIGITLWGFRPGMWRAQYGANLVLADGTEKPAMVWLQQYVRNNAPVVTSGQVFVLSANATAGTQVGTARATDADTGASLQNWKIVGGTAAAACSINASTGAIELTNPDALNWTSVPAYTLALSVSDGLTTSRSETVTLRRASGDQTVSRGTSANFSVPSTGDGSSAYQWEYSSDGGLTWNSLSDGGGYAGTQSAVLTVATPDDTRDGWQFRCVVTTGGTPATSAAATLNIGWSHFPALSARAPAGTGEQTLILGFVFAGGGKPTMVRGVGPGLLKDSPDLEGRVLADPQLKLYELQSGGFQLLAENNDWDSTSAMSTKFAELGLGALEPASKDAALHLTGLTRTVYSAHITSAAGTGVALAEAYDAANSDTTKRLTALSVRNQVGTGSDILIAGLVLEGDPSGPTKRVIVRGIGPGISSSVAAYLADPQLHVYRLKADRSGWDLVAQNDNWDSSSTTAALFEAVGMGELTVGSKDAALVLELPPGIYTAQVSGVGNTTGVGIVEVYEAP